MTPDLSSLESALRQLRPAALDEALLDRLDACTQDAWTQLDPAEARFTGQLGQVAPAPLPAELMASLEATLRGIPFPGADNILAFPQAQAHRQHRSWWRSAAAVALIGAASALFIPSGHHSATHATTHNTTQPPTARTTLPPATTNRLVPAGFNRSLAETRDEGVVWPSNQQPQRMLKVVYMDRVTLKDAAGRTYQVEQPRVEYILVPATAD